MSTIIMYLTDYKSEFGERQLRKLVNEVSTAKRFNSFISECKQRQFLPNTSDFYACIMNSIFYSFAGKHKLIALSMLLLNRWDEDVNQIYGLMDENNLDHFAKMLIQEGNQLGI